MKKRRLSTYILVIGMLLAVVATAAAQYDPQAVVNEAFTPASAQLDLARFDGELQTPRVFGFDGTPVGRVNAMVELTGAPAWQVYLDAQATGTRSSAVSAAQAQIQSNLAAQDSVMSAMDAAGIDSSIFYGVQRTYNGIALRTDAANLNAIASLPGVASVNFLPTHEIDNSGGVPLINAPAIWDMMSYDATGEGMSIAIIDTGVDYIHTGFGGSGMQADYDANDTTVVEAGTFPTAKVVGGIDFVGDAYDAGDDVPVVAPDDDPMDCQGHGSHVAGTAAGFGVALDGSTYSDGYGSDTDFSAMKVGAGSAPEADIYAVRVFGCGGSTNFTAAAIEYSTDPDGDGDPADAVDVINMSLGAGYGGANDASAAASNMAAMMGVIVVASAGNSGDAAHYVTGSPGTADYALSVAASADSQSVWDGIIVSGSSTGLDGMHAGAISTQYPWFDATAPVSQTIPVTAELVYPDDDTTGCAPFSEADAAKIAGNIVLLDWTTPSCGGSVTRTGNATAAGAAGILIADDAGGDLRIFGSAVTPALAVPQAVGDALRAELTATDRAGVLSVTIDIANLNAVVVVEPELVDTIADFTSRGPRRPMPNSTDALKPEISAPGLTIFSVERLSGSEGSTKSGTSMAAPHMAGVMAILKELNPDWSVEELKALAMNTSTTTLYTGLGMTGERHAPARVGTGRVDMLDSVDQSVIAYNMSDPGLVGVSFGDNQVVDTASATKTIAISNKGDSSATYEISFDIFTDAPGVEFSIAGEEEPVRDGHIVTIAAGETVEVDIMMTADASMMNHTFTDPAMIQFINTGAGRNWLTEESGQIVLSDMSEERDGHTLYVPVYASARPASDMAASGPVTLDESNSGVLSLEGVGVNTGPNLPVDVLSLVSALELQIVSPNEDTSAAEADSADLQYVGATSDFLSTITMTNPMGVITDTSLYFGVSTHGDWATMNGAEFDVYIDSDQDGTADYILFNWNVGSAFGQDPTDEFWTLVFDLGGGSLSFAGIVNAAPASLDTSPFNSNVAVLPVPATAVGITSPDQEFDYYVVTFDRDAGGAVDVTETVTFSPMPGLIMPAVTLADLDGEEIPVSIDTSVFVDSHDSKGILLLHHHNDASGSRAEVVQLQYEPTSVSFVGVDGASTSTTSWVVIAAAAVVALGAAVVIRRRQSDVA